MGAHLTSDRKCVPRATGAMRRGDRRAADQSGLADAHLAAVAAHSLVSATPPRPAAPDRLAQASRGCAASGREALSEAGRGDATQQCRARATRCSSQAAPGLARPLPITPELGQEPEPEPKLPQSCARAYPSNLPRLPGSTIQELISFVESVTCARALRATTEAPHQESRISHPLTWQIRLITVDRMHTRTPG